MLPLNSFRLQAFGSFPLAGLTGGGSLPVVQAPEISGFSYNPVTQVFGLSASGPSELFIYLTNDPDETVSAEDIEAQASITQTLVEGANSVPLTLPLGINAVWVVAKANSLYSTPLEEVVNVVAPVVAGITRVANANIINTTVNSTDPATGTLTVDAEEDVTVLAIHIYDGPGTTDALAVTVGGSPVDLITPISVSSSASVWFAAVSGLTAGAQAVSVTATDGGAAIDVRGILVQHLGYSGAGAPVAAGSVDSAGIVVGTLGPASYTPASASGFLLAGLSLDGGGGDPANSSFDNGTLVYSTETGNGGSNDVSGALAELEVTSAGVQSFTATFDNNQAAMSLLYIPEA